jgi:hypothetical protein
MMHNTIVSIPCNDIINEGDEKHRKSEQAQGRGAANDKQGRIAHR